MRRLFILLAAFSLLAYSCTVEDIQNPVDDSSPLKIVFETPVISIVDEVPATKVSVLPDEVSDPNTITYSYLWESADTVGIFPNAGSQVYFSMAGGEGTTHADFDGGAWSLRGSARYYSYYPFVGDMYLDSSRIPVDFTGQHQAGTNNYSGSHIYFASSGTSSSGSILRFSYQMLNTMLRFDATLPVGTYTKLTLTLDDPLFVKEGHFDLSNPSIVAEHYTRTMEVALENFTVSSANSPVSIYVAQAPLDLRGQTMMVNIYSSDGRRYSYASHPGKAYIAGMCYRFRCSMTTIAPSRWMQTNVWPLDGNGNPDVSQIPNYDANQNIPYLQWYAQPANPTGPVALLIGGEDYNDAPNEALLDEWAAAMTARGVQCVALMYRTPRPAAPQLYFQSCWADAQRAIRIIRNAVWLDHEHFPFDRNKIGVVGWSAGAHVGMILAASSGISAYSPVDVYELTNNGAGIPTNINWAILQSPAYFTADSDGTLPSRGASLTETTISPRFSFDSNTPSICMLQGQDDPYSPLGITLAYRQLRLRGIPAEVHLYPGVGHEPVGFERGIEYLTQMGFFGTVPAEQDITARFASDAARGQYILENVWPAGQIPNQASNMSIPTLEWHFPVNRKTKAIQIIYSGGAYEGSDSNNIEVAPIRRYLNAKGVTVVTLNYRYKLPVGRPDGLPKHLAPWQDLQRTIRIVRSKAEQYGLDPDRIGIMGFSAGGHLTLMGATSSMHQSYSRIDSTDDIPCNVQWAIPIYPAYSLTDDDGYHGGSAHGGNLDSDVLVPEFSFDLATPPMLLMHGDADAFASMASVKVWEQLNRMGLPAECHTFATRGHCFQCQASPGTGSYNCFDRVWDYIEPWLY